MKSYLPDFQITAAGSLEEAFQSLEMDHDLKPIAGGTDLMVLFESGKLAFKKLLSLHNLVELKGIRVENDFIEIGALTTFKEIASHDILNNEFSLIGIAARETGALAIQNRGTIGGNIINASPAADTPPALLVYDTQIALGSQTGERWISYDSFHKEYKKTELKQGELLTKIRIRRDNATAVSSYKKIGTRKAQAISKVCFAARAVKNDSLVESIKIAFGSVAPTPVRCKGVEKIIQKNRLESSLIEQACVQLQKEICPIDDIRSTEKYRRKVAENLLRDFLNNL